ncbi:LysR family transcriptional regulator [Vibrio navarrensis]
MIKSEWLKTFCVLAQTENFRQAADLLYMTQPGVSQHLAKLERYLNQTLIIRESKSFELTPKGQEVLTYAQDLLANERQLIERLADDDPHKGVVRLSMPGGVGNLIYPWILDLQIKHPKLVIHIEFNPSEIVEKLLSDNTCDIGLVTHHFDNKDYSSTLFLKEKRWLVLPKNTLAQSYAQLLELGFIDHPAGKKMAAKVLSALYPHEPVHIEQIPVNAYTNSAPRICHHVAKGLGFTVLDEFMVRLSPVFNQLTIIDAPQVPPEEIYFIYKNTWPVHPRGQYVMEYLSERAKQYLQHHQEN